ncbi:hypothetical protein NEUTE1DRAFT_125626 [Neurospora tetrasperma FGSC 2508]|uniref:DUF1917-domain-containing protein n=1 Tax=Neurospora tetrasperma (strain FGSC 2508 / ATCC MYA-4615 / P0657) TaxID=510951 RepID=F8MZT6_NEUT8|nr:uncharacterized protein NEUTE1DRAFT_125626 [Neurospora tetrasperma FGSC 2508]EGO52073.1 hypothetical protein NEUTE1DRAFT_125626 [Neurospora tetrasperma FGSC 2508]
MAQWPSRSQLPFRAVVPLQISNRMNHLSRPQIRSYYDEPTTPSHLDAIYRDPKYSRILRKVYGAPFQSLAKPRIDEWFAYCLQRTSPYSGTQMTIRDRTRAKHEWAQEVLHLREPYNRTPWRWDSLSQRSEPPVGVRQPGEPVADFLDRLPPVPGPKMGGKNDRFVPRWYVVENPNREAYYVKGYLDHGKAHEPHRFGLWIANLRNAYMTFFEQVAYKRRIGRMSEERYREELREFIGRKARQFRLVRGEWMISVPTSEATKVWSEIAQATDLNILGTSARIATSSLIDYPNHQLIAVQTVDFSNHEDVERVLRRLEGMGIVDRTSTPPISYQTEAYYFLGIGPNNIHNLPTAFYTSEQFFNDELRSILRRGRPGQILDESLLRGSEELQRKQQEEQEEQEEIADFGRIWNQEPEEKKRMWIPPQVMVQRDPNVFQELEIAKAEAERERTGRKKKVKRMTMKEWKETEDDDDPVAMALNAKRVE